MGAQRPRRVRHVIGHLLVLHLEGGPEGAETRIRSEVSDTEWNQLRRRLVRKWRRRWDRWIRRRRERGGGGRRR